MADPNPVVLRPRAPQMLVVRTIDAAVSPQDLRRLEAKTLQSLRDLGERRGPGPRFPWSGYCLDIARSVGSEAFSVEAKTRRENPWIKKGALHCEEYIRDADTLAASAERFAEFHTMRAAELQGQ